MPRSNALKAFHAANLAWKGAMLVQGFLMLTDAAADDTVLGCFFVACALATMTGVVRLFKPGVYGALRVLRGWMWGEVTFACFIAIVALELDSTSGKDGFDDDFFKDDDGFWAGPADLGVLMAYINCGVAAACVAVFTCEKKAVVEAGQAGYMPGAGYAPLPPGYGYAAPAAQGYAAPAAQGYPGHAPVAYAQPVGGPAPAYAQPVGAPAAGAAAPPMATPVSATGATGTPDGALPEALPLD